MNLRVVILPTLDSLQIFAGVLLDGVFKNNSTLLSILVNHAGASAVVS